MSKLWLVRFIPAGAGTNLDCWYRTAEAAQKVYGDAHRRREAWNTDQAGAFLAHDIQDDFGVRTGINLIGAIIIMTDTETSARLAKAINAANTAASTDGSNDAGRWFEKTKGSS